MSSAVFEGAERSSDERSRDVVVDPLILAHAPRCPTPLLDSPATT